MDRFSIGSVEWLKNEAVVLSANNVGIYEQYKSILFHRNIRLQEFDDGELQLTAHRIIWRNSLHCLSLSLSLIRNAELQAAFLKSSAKITLSIGGLEELAEAHETFYNIESGWICSVCSFSNMNCIKCLQCGVSKSKSVDQLWSCAACTFQNNHLLSECEICGTAKPSFSSHLAVIKFSFRSGSSTSFYSALQNALQSQAWKSIQKPQENKQSYNAGIAGLMKQMDSSMKMQDSSLSSAFSDIDALVRKASEMVSLAEQISSKLSSSSADSLDEDESTEFKSLLLNLGLSNPVTKARAGNSYHSQLAVEICTFLDKISSQSQKMIWPLPDIYCLYNRARGTALISPQDLSSACSLMNSLSLSFYLHKFDSGLLSLRHKSHSEENLASLISSWISVEPLSILAVANKMNTSFIMARYQLQYMEKRGILCRDDGFHCVTYYPNKILQD